MIDFFKIGPNFMDRRCSELSPFWEGIFLGTVVIWSCELQFHKVFNEIQNQKLVQLLSQ